MESTDTKSMIHRAIAAYVAKHGRPPTPRVVVKVILGQIPPTHVVRAVMAELCPLSER